LTFIIEREGIQKFRNNLPELLNILCNGKLKMLKFLVQTIDSWSVVVDYDSGEKPSSIKKRKMKHEEATFSD